LVAANDFSGFTQSPAGTSTVTFQNQAQLRRLRPAKGSLLAGCALIEIVRCPLKLKGYKAVIITLALACGVHPLPAGGSWYRNNMLDRGDEAVLVAPVANYHRELDRMMPASPPGGATNDATDSHDPLTGELADLRAALLKARVAPGDASEIVTNFQFERTRLDEFDQALNRWRDSAGGDWVDGTFKRGTPTEPRPPFPAIVIGPKLPEEFADYFDGAIQWHNPAVSDKKFARDAWERILKLPLAERRYKSVWAAFMLGKSWESEDPARAADCYQQVRKLAKAGCVDSAGLVAASLGLEARIALRQKDFTQAINLYLDQYEAKGEGAAESLKVAARQALEAGPEGLPPLAEDARARRLVTAYLISRYTDSSDSDEDKSVVVWLAAVEAANVQDTGEAEQFALAAYQANHMALTQRWIDRAAGTPTAQWLQAKLLLRRGKVPEATATLARVAELFPVEHPDPDNPANRSFADDLSVTDRGRTPASRYIRGELGALQLSHGDYTPALDSLLRGGFWLDGAYVAERVLSVDELKGYVDENWPPDASTNSADTNAPASGEESASSAPHPGADIRYLLARRLTRELRSTDARPYYPIEMLPQVDALIGALRTGWDETAPADQRAEALFTAAGIARTNGMELLGTETAPDWHFYDGDFEGGVTLESRTNEEPKILRPTPDELRRAAVHKPDPDERFHYRFQAAFLAWEAARLLPDNSEQMARVLYTAGSWLKNRDPQTADLFYKALVRHCRNTALGDEADRRRWFPPVDENWNPIPRLPSIELDPSTATQDELPGAETETDIGSIGSGIPDDPQPTPPDTSVNN
jgi:hypothetical protein